MKHKGFTLIEIIVVIAIVSILMSVGLAYYNKSNEEKELRSDTEKLSDILHLARQKAISGDQKDLPACTDFNGYQVEIIDSGSYRLVLCCNDACTGADREEIQSYSLQSSITLDPSSSTIKFKKLTGETLSALDVKVSNSVISECLLLNIQLSGLIKLDTSCSY